MKKISPKQLTWITKPRLYMANDERIVLETEPFTDLRSAYGGAEAIELSLSTNGSFNLTARNDFDFKNPFDQCGLMIYAGDKRKALIGTEARDNENIRLQCIVFHADKGDLSVRDIGSGIRTMYYRIWYRGGAVRIQYSFTGIRYSDFREFRMDPQKNETVRIGIYACSPMNSSFDCTFSEMVLDD